ncbi:MAG: Alginate biosynthesis protein AlgA [Wendovervirus sonii]|uniref:Alginate biosynthesis protein AlgA n=1 Tax=phage Lak_Megaphage_Sonny TaxID=3109229 RepID=A0ABZ0Z3A0_9CAUD|nr:MAG: Alginate biosynthesis protein AlgA [phage Lak_Megaphage_Sonny]
MENPERPMYEERHWGTYQVVEYSTYADGSQSLTKKLVIKAGKNISYQLHHYRTEVWTFVDGDGLLKIDGTITKVTRGDVAVIKNGQKHAVKALSDLTLIEVQYGNPLIEEDIERLEIEWTE